MPIDQNEEDDGPKGEELGRNRRFNDFDCPECNANNPWDDGFGDGDEIRCFYCGLEFEVEVNDSGKIRFREA
jgi:hypothetical protein